MLAQSGWVPERPLCIALVFAGAVDPLTEAFRRVSGAAVEVGMVIEEDDTRREIVQRVFRAQRAYRDARRAAKFPMGIDIDVLHATPSCKRLSTAPHWRQDQLAEKAEEARGSSSRTWTPSAISCDSAGRV